VGRVTLKRMNERGIMTIGDLATSDPAALKSLFGTMGTHLHELASGNDARSVDGDWHRKSYGEENTFAHDHALDSLELRRALIAHGDAIARRLRDDGVRARTITLKLKLARPLGGGRYPLITRSFSLDTATNDGPEISRLAIHLLSKVDHKDKIRLAGVQVHQIERVDSTQFGLFESAPVPDRKRDRLNRALDSVAKKFGDEAVTRGLARVERAAPSKRIK
jgi:DNA polymerase IV